MFFSITEEVGGLEIFDEEIKISQTVKNFYFLEDLEFFFKVEDFGRDLVYKRSFQIRKEQNIFCVRIYRCVYVQGKCFYRLFFYLY